MKLVDMLGKPNNATGHQLQQILEQPFEDTKSLLPILESLRQFAESKAKILELETALLESWDDSEQHPN